MEEAKTTPSLYGGERGIGGKFRKPSSKKPPPKPYDRPPSNQSDAQAQPRDGGWFSNLVDPAYRLFFAGANKILPSFLSKSTSEDVLLPITDDNDKGDTVVALKAIEDEKCTSNFEMPESSALQSSYGVGPSNTADLLKSNSKFDELRRDESKNMENDYDFSKIEQLVKGKRFSRDEINHLLGILNSRVTDLSHVERETTKLGMTVGRDTEIMVHEKLKKSIGKEQEDVNRAGPGSPTGLLPSDMQNDVGASPIDIARAYMGSRTSEAVRGSYGIISKNERSNNWSNEYQTNPLVHTTSPKSSPCWPGTILQDQHNHLTPYSERGRYGLHNFPRTPYSRTLFSKSKGKVTQLQADSRWQNNSCNHIQKSSTPFYTRLNSSSSVLDDSYGSVGPIRRVRHKFASEARPKGSIFQISSQNASSPIEKTSVSKDLHYATMKNLEPGETSGTSKEHTVDNMAHDSGLDAHTINTSTGEAVRKILEHLDRKMPTPKEKAAELKLATGWRKRHSKETKDVPKDNIDFTFFKGVNSEKNIERSSNTLLTNFKTQEGCVNGVTHNKVTDGGNAIIKVSSTVGDTGTIFDANTEPSSTSKNGFDSQIKNIHERAFMGTEGTNGKAINKEVNGHDSTMAVADSSHFELSKKPPLHCSGAKASLTSISINKPDLSRAFSSDNAAGFTFPVYASSGAFSEPPTPSILPSLAVSGSPQSKEGPEIPSYSFGTKRSEPRLVFSFPSTSSASTKLAASDLKFNFGSDKKKRVSFKSVGKDAVCC